jgi:type II secretory pathway pseudopilin PulG
MRGTRHNSKPASMHGFSIVELMVSIVIMMIVLGGVFSVIDVVNQRSYTEQSKLDMFQEAREFMDQMSRDLHQAGYPSVRHYVSTGQLTADPVTHDVKNAVGIVKVGAGDLWFEGDVDGTGAVSVVRYHLDNSTTNGCPCLRRSQLPKIEGDPVAGQSTEVYQVQVQGVQNTDIFSAFARGTTGTPIGLPVDFSTDPDTIATVDTIKAVLSLRALTKDPRTGVYPEATLVATAKLNNCSQATTLAAMSCAR